MTIIENATPTQAAEIQAIRWLERNAESMRRELFKGGHSRATVGMLTFAIVPMVKGRSQLTGCGIGLISHVFRPQGAAFQNHVAAIGMALAKAADPVGEMVQGPPLGVASPLD